MVPRSRLRSCRAPAAALLLAASFAGAVKPAVAERSELIVRYLERAAQDLRPEAQSALHRIHGTPRQLLAARAYLRAEDNLAARWSWSDVEIARFERSPEHVSLLAEIDRVRRRFERENTGYTLYANTQVRSLDLQLDRWNENAGVERTAAHLHRAAREELSRSDYSAVPDARSLDSFARFLRAWRPPVAAPLAAPGLSLHGQLRAIDFQVMRAGKIVAGTQIAAVRTIWEGQGWRRKLQDAVADSAFVGPLRFPNEPWHYEYAPPSRYSAARLSSAGSAAGQ